MKTLLASLLQSYSLFQLFNVYGIGCSILLFFLYRWLWQQVQPSSVHWRKKLYLSLALGLLVLVKGTPIDLLGKHYFLSLHVMQLACIFFIVLPLLVLSLPTRLLQERIWHHWTRSIFHLVSHPWLSLVLFNGTLSLYLVPTVFTFLQSKPAIQMLYQGALVILGACMWFVIIQPVQIFQRENPLLRALYIFLASLFLLPISLYLLIADTTLFPYYASRQADFLPEFHSLYDQQLAAGILKISQMSSYALALLTIVFTWSRKEREREGLVMEKHLRYVRGVVVHMEDRKK